MLAWVSIRDVHRAEVQVGDVGCFERVIMGLSYRDQITSVPNTVGFLNVDDTQAAWGLERWLTDFSVSGRA
jgi:hypothetical protein